MSYVSHASSGQTKSNHGKALPEAERRQGEHTKAAQARRVGRQPLAENPLLSMQASRCLPRCPGTRQDIALQPCCTAKGRRVVMSADIIVPPPLQRES